MIYRLHEGDVLSPSLLLKILNKAKLEEIRRKKLFDYFVGNHNINSRQTADENKPNNRVTNPYPYYITTLMTGYFMGEPVKYSSDNEELMNQIADINKYNDEQSNDDELAKNASICGVAYELLYIDADGEVRFKSIDPRGCIAIYDDGIDPEMLYFIRQYTDYSIVEDKDINYVEVYGLDDIKLYRYTDGAVRLIETREQLFPMCPVVEYSNNAEQMGDFERVIPQIDAYDALVSDSLNDADYFSDAYLALYGMMGTTDDDVSNMKKNRVLLMDTNSKAEWLTKNVSDTAQEDIKNRIAEDIHKFSLCPAMTDESFAQNASGVSLRYKLMGLENVTANKESYFKKGLQKRLEIICSYLSLIGKAEDYRDIRIEFTRNLPSNIIELSDTVNKLSGVLSNRTLLNMLPLDIDIDAEMEQRKAEQEDGYDVYNFGAMNDNGNGQLLDTESAEE